VPVYEFACNNCNSPLSVFVRSVNSEVGASCERCGSKDLRRLVSKFAVIRGPGSVSLDDLAGLDENDPRAMAAWARQMQAESGEDMGPEFEDMVGRLERGEPIDDDLGLSADGYDHDYEFGDSADDDALL
jgi:putative FmdB family regulatory protein